MSELIPIQDQGDGVQAVMGRDLYKFLEVKEQYADWMKRMVTYGFEEGRDYATQKPEAGATSGFVPGGNRIDHIITLDMAKEISMIQRTDKGKQARQYFIECERRYRSGEMSELDEAKLVQRALQVTYRQVQELTAANAEMQPKASYYDEFVAAEDLIQFRTLANQLNIKEKHLRELLIQKKWIYRMSGQRWSNKREQVVTTHQYRAYADKKHLFRLIPCHEAPRVNGEVQQSLKLTPHGAEAVARAVKRWGSQIVLPYGDSIDHQ